MYYKPRFFKPEEIFPKSIIINEQVWRLMDERVLLTLDRLRIAYGPVIVNNYLFGGDNQYRGYRPATELINKSIFDYNGDMKPEFSSFTSQHCFGRAIDCTFRDATVQEVRDDIKSKPLCSTFVFITAVEEEVPWLHFDVRAWNKPKHGILFF